MNERIRELAKQADDYERKLGKGIGPTRDEKFAELIVRECAGVGYDASYYECALNVSNKIREHFGVEQ
jgi:hypothetical protein